MAKTFKIPRGGEAADGPEPTQASNASVPLPDGPQDEERRVAGIEADRALAALTALETLDPVNETAVRTEPSIPTEPEILGDAAIDVDDGSEPEPVLDDEPASGEDQAVDDALAALQALEDEVAPELAGSEADDEGEAGEEPELTRMIDAEASEEAASGVAESDALEAEVLEDLDEEVPRRARKRRGLRNWHVVAIILLLIIVGASAFVGYFAWDRWYRYDDQADLEGTWYVLGTDVPIQITQDTIQFTENTAYFYSIDDQTKIITYRLGNLEGEGHYRFMDDRRFLIITDGDEFSPYDTASSDLIRLFGDIGRLSSGRSIQLPGGEGIIVLCRDPDVQGIDGQGYELPEPKQDESSSKSKDKAKSEGSSSADSSSSSASGESSSSDSADKEGASDASEGADDPADRQPKDVFDAIGDLR